METTHSQGVSAGSTATAPGPLTFAASPTRAWFQEAFEAPTGAQSAGWPPIAAGDSTLLLAPTGSGKTLAAFLAAIDRLMFRTPVEADEAVRVLYVSPLKALGVDIERNLRAPLAGIRAVAERLDCPYRPVRVGVRTGDTSARERRDLVRHPPDILITTPESLYLMLTSQARETLRHVETVIVDEIHAVAGTKRGVHLALTLERLEWERRLHGFRPPGSNTEGDESPGQASPGLVDRNGGTVGSADLPRLQRIGLSATQRPLEEIARLLGGFEPLEVELSASNGAMANLSAAARLDPRPVSIVNAAGPKAYEVAVEMPVEDMTRLGEVVDDEIPSGPVTGGGVRRSIWPSIHPRLVELIRAHRSTLIFVNSRRLAERLAAAVNELAEEELAMAHHGSIARAARVDIEDRLKAGQLPALVATSTLELGIDMGAIDLVIQIGAPPSVASGIQRFGRSGHTVGATSKGAIFPKFRLDLAACAAVSEHIQTGHVESTRYPRNALDVLAQQVVATVATGEAGVEEMFAVVRGAAPYAELTRSSFESVLDLLSGRYPSDDFRELRPRLNWDRLGGRLTARRGARMLAVTSGGTIPDRGLYGVFLAGTDAPVRVGELDEEMVFESREGDVFVLGASSWRIEEIDVDRVLVSPAPGEPGKMPFWRGEGPGRPIEFGRAIGALTRELAAADDATAAARLRDRHGLDERAAANLLALLEDQKEATGSVPSDRTIVLERFTDDMGDECVAVLSPFGSPVHAPWAMAISATLRREHGLDVDVMWGDDGIVFRLSSADEPPADDLFLPDPDEVRDLVVEEVGGTALFAARFRENAARALLLPRRRPGKRTPLWAQRRRSADLLRAVADHPDFPIMLETYREVLSDVFDLNGLVQLLSEIRQRRVRFVPVENRIASPHAASLMFGYVANFLYEGDAPLAERRAHALTLDHAQLLELLGEPEMRELLDPEAVEDVARQAARLDGRLPLRDEDDLHDLLRTQGDLTVEEILARSGPRAPEEATEPATQDATRDTTQNATEGATEEAAVPIRTWLESLRTARRAIPVRIAGETRWIAAEDAGRLRDAVGVQPPPGLPGAFIEPVADALGEVVSRFARTRGPFAVDQLTARYQLGLSSAARTLADLAERGRVTSGHFLRDGAGEEWCDTDVLRRIKRRSLARLRADVEPVEPAALTRFLVGWHGLDRPRRGPDALLEVLAQLQGAVIPLSDLEECVLPARLEDYDPRDLDALCSSGQVVWRGVGSLPRGDGRIALYLRRDFLMLAPDPDLVEGELTDGLLEMLDGYGGVFFDDLVAHTSAFPPQVFEALWDLVWAGRVTNDTLAPLRELRASERSRRRRHDRAPGIRPGSGGRWSLLPGGGVRTVDGERPASRRETRAPSATERATALTAQLLERHGVVTREAVRFESIGGGFSGVYPVLKRMEETGRVRRGYFVEGLGAAQFALPGGAERLRRARHVDLRDLDPGERVRVLAANDPANPWGAALRWPERPPPRPRRAAGARVILIDGALRGWMSRSGARVLTFLDDADDPAEAAELMVSGLVHWLEGRRRRVLTIRSVDGEAPAESPLAVALRAAEFRPTSRGWRYVRPRAGAPPGMRARMKRKGAKRRRDRAGG